MDTTATRTFPAKRRRISEMLDFVRTTAQELGMPERCEMPLSLAVDEALANVCDYAYRDAGDTGTVALTLHPAGTGRTGLVVEIADCGAPFNPLDVPPPDIHGELDNRQPGGLGIHLIREFASDVRYDRREDRNVLTITFEWKVTE